jgi:hypothetical protein
MRRQVEIRNSAEVCLNLPLLAFGALLFFDGVLRFSGPLVLPHCFIKVGVRDDVRPNLQLTAKL